MAIYPLVDESMQALGQMIKTQEWKELEKDYQFRGKDLRMAIYQDGVLLGTKMAKNYGQILGKDLGAKSSGLFGLGKCKNIKAHFCNCQPWACKLELRGSTLNNKSVMFLGRCECNVTDIDFNKFYDWAKRIGFQKENNCDLSLYQFQNLVVNLFVKKVWETSLLTLNLNTNYWSVALKPAEQPDFFNTLCERVKTNIANMGITVNFKMISNT